MQQQSISGSVKNHQTAYCEFFPSIRGCSEQYLETVH